MKVIKINKMYIERFKLSHNEYLYPVSKGIYLAFDKDTFKYIGIELFYLADPKKCNKLVDNKINELVSKDILEVLNEK